MKPTEPRSPIVSVTLNHRNTLRTAFPSQIPAFHNELCAQPLGPGLGTVPGICLDPHLADNEQRAAEFQLVSQTQHTREVGHKRGTSEHSVNGAYVQ
jgi:hypothetical protein